MITTISVSGFPDVCFPVFKLLKKKCSYWVFFPVLLTCTCESGFWICFLPHHLARLRTHISCCHLLLHPWVWCCLLTSRVLHLILCLPTSGTVILGLPFTGSGRIYLWSPTLFTLVLVQNIQFCHVVYKESCWHTTNYLLFLFPYPVIWSALGSGMFHLHSACYQQDCKRFFFCKQANTF